MIKGRGTLRIGPFVTIEDGVLLDLGPGPSGMIELGARVKLKRDAVLRAYNGEIAVGARSTIGEFSVLAGHGGLRIGRAVIISGHCYLSAGEHLKSGLVPVRFQGEQARGITVEDEAWLGAHVTVHDGVCVGARAVVGSGSVVTRSLPAATVCLGMPCRIAGRIAAQKAGRPMNHPYPTRCP